MRHADNGKHIVPLLSERRKGHAGIVVPPDWRKPSDRLPRHLWRGVPATFIKATDYAAYFKGKHEAPRGKPAETTYTPIEGDKAA